MDNEIKKIPWFEFGDIVRKIKRKNTFDKEKPNFWENLYIIIGIEKNR